jgi:delta-aminolevulinic acid dehydratase/porphobilinogen synthase
MSLHPTSASSDESSLLHGTRAALRAKRPTGMLAPMHLIWPLFVQEGVDQVTPIASMPSCARAHTTLRSRCIR